MKANIKAIMNDGSKLEIFFESSDGKITIKFGDIGQVYYLETLLENKENFLKGEFLRIDFRLEYDIVNMKEIIEYILKNKKEIVADVVEEAL